MKDHSGIQHRKLDVTSHHIRQLPHIVTAKVFSETKDILVVLSRRRDYNNENVSMEFCINDLSAVQLRQTNLMTTAAEIRYRRVLRTKQVLNRQAIKHPRRAHHNICN